MPGEIAVLAGAVVVLLVGVGAAYAAWTARQPALDLLHFQVAALEKDVAAAEERTRRITAEFDRYVQDAEADEEWRADARNAARAGGLREWVLRDAAAAAGATAEAPAGGGAEGSDAAGLHGVGEGAGTHDVRDPASGSVDQEGAGRV